MLSFCHKLSTQGNLKKFDFLCFGKHYIFVNHWFKIEREKKSHFSGVSWQKHTCMFLTQCNKCCQRRYVYSTSRSQKIKRLIICSQWPCSCDSIDTLFQALILTNQDCCYNLFTTFSNPRWFSICHLKSFLSPAGVILSKWYFSLA